MYGCFLAKARGAKTIAFGTHVTPIPRETMRPFPALDFRLIGEPDLTIARSIGSSGTENRTTPGSIKKLLTITITNIPSD